MRFHVVSLPHTQLTAEYVGCAYSQKVVNFARMMTSLGHEVINYASEESEAPGELVTLLTKAEQRELFGAQEKDRFFNITWNPDDPHWQLMNRRAIDQIGKRIRPGDFICLIAGVCQKQIADAFPNHQAVEYGIGYTGVFANYRVFESYSHMHWVYGNQNTDDGRFYDTVIPNYFDPTHFPYRRRKDDYFLFIGRMIDRKGWRIAVEATERIGAKLIMAGQHDTPLPPLPPHVEHVGFADRQKRGELMAGARAVFVPTTYVEPFGGVSIEAMMCGTPVISTDWGAFAENVIDGQTGYRFRTLGEAVWAAENAHRLKPRKIRNYAVQNFSLDRVRHLYQAYFDQLADLWGDGWYTTRHDGTSTYRRYQRTTPTGGLFS